VNMTDLLLLDSPDSIFEDLWSRLVRGVDDPAHPFRFAVIATARLDGAPAARNVVLRRAEREARRLVFCTDARSPKVAQMRADPRVAWVFWDPADKLQLRMESIATLHVGDEIAAAQWALVPAGNRVVYQSPLVSGQTLSRVHTQPPPATGGSEYFCVAVCAIRSIDWLVLCEGGHRRARFSGEELERFEWLAP